MKNEKESETKDIFIKVSDGFAWNSICGHSINIDFSRDKSTAQTSNKKPKQECFLINSKVLFQTFEHKIKRMLKLILKS